MQLNTFFPKKEWFAAVFTWLHEGHTVTATSGMMDLKYW